MNSTAPIKTSPPRDSLRIRPTRSGWILVFLLLWIPLTAIGTANNFLLIIFALMVGLALVSHRLARKNVKTVQLSRCFPDEIFAGNVFTVRYLVKTVTRPWGAVTLKFVEASPLQGATEGVTFSHIPPGDAVSVNGSFSVSSRGDKQIFPGLLTSAFPFGLASYSRSCGPTESVLVFPQIQSVEEDVPPWVGGSGKGPERPDPFGTIPYQFREYVPGDPYKHIEWKKTARYRGAHYEGAVGRGRPRDYHSYAKGSFREDHIEGSFVGGSFCAIGPTYMPAGPGHSSGAGAGQGICYQASHDACTLGKQCGCTHLARFFARHCGGDRPSR